MIPPPDIAANPWPLATLSFPTDPKGIDYLLFFGYLQNFVTGITKNDKPEYFYAYHDSSDFRPAHIIDQKTQQVNNFGEVIQTLNFKSNLSPTPVYSGYDIEGAPSGNPLYWSLTAHWHPMTSGLIASPPSSLTGALAGVQYIPL